VALLLLDLLCLDELKGKNMWLSEYDGQAIAGASYKDALPSVNIKDLRSGMLLRLRSLIEDSEAKEEQIGLVTEVKAAGEIVKEVRESVRLYLEAAIKGL
jgi:nitronate monooxygenase